MKQRILVTGSSGFIGHHLTAALAKEKHGVIALDRLAPRQEIASVDYVVEDLRTCRQLGKIAGEVDAVFHLAAESSVPRCESQVQEGYGTNVLGTSALLKALADSRPSRKSSPRVVFASSSAVYGNAPIGPKGLTEDQTETLPASHYGLQKWMAEKMFALSFSRGQTAPLLFRLFNVYGPSINPDSNGVIQLFCQAAATGKDLVVHGNGKQRRDFVHVDDVVKAFLSALKLPLSNLDSRVINIGTGTSTSVSELANLVLKAAGRPLPIRFLNPRPGDVDNSKASTALLSRITKWIPETTLLEGLRSLIQTLKETPKQKSLPAKNKRTLRLVAKS